MFYITVPGLSPGQFSLNMINRSMLGTTWILRPDWATSTILSLLQRKTISSHDAVQISQYQPCCFCGKEKNLLNSGCPLLCSNDSSLSFFLSGKKKHTCTQLMGTGSQWGSLKKNNADLFTMEVQEIIKVAGFCVRSLSRLLFGVSRDSTLA